MIRRPLVVEAPQHDLLVAVVLAVEGNAAARIWTGWKARADIERGRREQRRRYGVAGERGRQGDGASVVARWRRDLRKVAGQHPGRRHVGECRRRRDVNVCSLVTDEVEQPVPKDGAAEGSAELVAAQAVIAPFAVGTDRRKRIR